MRFIVWLKGKNGLVFQGPHVWRENKSLMINHWTKQYKEKKFSDGIYKSC
jgi:hypothetical protein